MSHVCSVFVSGAGSGMCELTNQSGLGIHEGEGLKEIKQSVSDCSD